MGSEAVSTAGDVFDRVIRPAFIAVVGAEPHRGHATNSDPNEWNGLYRHLGHPHDPLIIAVDLKAAGGEVTVRRAYSGQDMLVAVVPLKPDVDAQGLYNAMNEAIVAWLTGPTDAGPKTA